MTPVSDFDGLVSAYASDAELDAEATVRPKRLAEFVAQHRVRDQLDLLLKSAMRRGSPPDHILLSGSPGLGKTTLANDRRGRAGRGHADDQRPGDRALR